MNFNIPELRAFIEVVRRGSFSGAAVELNLSQPALSRRIDMIESTLGARLLDRHHDGSRLTAAGRSFLPHAEAALAELRDGMESVRSTHRGESGRLVVALVASLCNRAAMEALERFRRESPAIQLTLHTATSAEVSRLVQSGDASFGVRYRPDPDRRLECSPLGHETMIVVCSPRNPIAAMKSVSVSRLAEETWIVWPLRPNEPDGGFPRVLAGYGLKKGDSIMVTDSTILQKQLIEADFGIGIMSARSVEADLAAGTLCAPNVPAMRGAIPVAMIRRRGAHVSATTQRLMDSLTEAYSTLQSQRSPRRKTSKGASR